MKRKMSRLLLILFCLIILIPTVIFAAWTDGGGTGSSSGNSGGTNTGGSECMPGGYNQIGVDHQGSATPRATPAAYRFDLVYKPQSGGRYILKTVVVQLLDKACNDISGEGCYANSMITATKDYVTAINKSGVAQDGAKYVNGGPLADLALKLFNGRTVDELFPDGLGDENAELIESYITDSDGFGMDPKDMQKEQDENPGTLNSFGYRIMIQKLVTVTNYCSNYDNWRVATRKDATANSAVWRAYVGNKFIWIAPYNNQAASDLFTTRDDIGVHNAISEMNFFRNASNGATVRELQDEFADPNNGSGFNILWFSTDPFKNYDYSLDAACVNCDNTSADNVAYTIKDINNWDAIMVSTDSDSQNVQNHFKADSNSDVLCREEFTVYFPNAKDTVYVEPGRYFVLHPSDSEIAELSHFGASSIPNLKPVKVYRKRECQANVQLTQGKNESDAAFAARVHQAKITALRNYESSNKNSFKGDLGTVYFRYTETYDESNYSMSEPEKMRKYTKSSDEYKSKLDDAAEMLTMEAMGYYTLPENYYQYIRLQDGLSMKKKPTSNLNTDYKNVGISNLPVSFENKGEKIDATTAKAADIQFAYDLPANSQLSEAASDPNFLATKDPDDNIYEQYLNGEVDASNPELQSSACAEFYTIGSSDFRKCAQDRVSNKSGSAGGTCISKSTIMGSNPLSGYSCEVLTSNDDPGDGCNSAEDAKRLGLEWNSKGNYCCPAGTEYNSETGKCDSGPGDNSDCKTEEDANRLGLSWNSKEGYCCPIGTTYNPSTGRCEGGSTDDDGECKTESDAKKYGVDWNPVTRTCCPAGTKYNPETGKCLKGNETDPVCPTSECPYGCCPSGECAPMPDGTCPGPGGIDVIYRTIDLEDPFPGQAADTRDTGSNWCSYSNGVYRCEYNNKTPQYFITNRGSNIYDESHVLYEVTLDTSTIKAVRRYNDKNKYDDFDLDCRENGRRCYSDFLKGTELSGNISGLCYNVDTNNFYSCDKD